MLQLSDSSGIRRYAARRVGRSQSPWGIMVVLLFGLLSAKDQDELVCVLHDAKYCRAACSANVRQDCRYRTLACPRIVVTGVTCLNYFVLPIAMKDGV